MPLDRERCLCLFMYYYNIIFVCIYIYCVLVSFKHSAAVIADTDYTVKV